MTAPAERTPAPPTRRGNGRDRNFRHEVWRVMRRFGPGAHLGIGETALPRFNAAFAQRIRGGRHDPGSPAPAAATAILGDRLARVAPKRLRAARQGGKMPDDAAPWPPDD